MLSLRFNALPPHRPSMINIVVYCCRPRIENTGLLSPEQQLILFTYKRVGERQYHRLASALAGLAYT